MEKLPKKGWGELNRWSKHIGVHPSLLSQVLSGTKDLNLEQAQALAELLGLMPIEADYFLLLVQWERAGTQKLKKYFKNKMDEIVKSALEISQQVRQDRSLSEEEKSIFYSHWLYAAIWLRSSLKDGCTVDNVSSFFGISSERSNEILNFLLETQLCVRKDGACFMGPQSIHLSRQSPHITKHHTNWRLRAIENSDRITEEEVMYSAPMSLSKADVGKVRNLILELIRQATDIAIASEAEKVICMNVDLFELKK